MTPLVTLPACKHRDTDGVRLLACNYAGWVIRGQLTLQLCVGCDRANRDYSPPEPQPERKPRPPHYRDRRCVSLGAVIAQAACWRQCDCVCAERHGGADGVSHDSECQKCGDYAPAPDLRK